MIVGTQRILSWTVVISSLLFMSSCKKKESEPEPGATRPPRPVKKVGTKKRLTPSEVRSLAKQRLLAAKKDIPPYDRNAGLRDAVFDLYTIDLNTLLSNGTFNLDELKDVEEVTAILEDRAAKAIAIRYPDSQLKEMQEDVITRFPYHKLNDVISVTIKRPDGTTFEKKGRLMNVAEKSIMVGGTRVLYVDLQKPAKWSFKEDAVMRKRNSYIYDLYTLPKGKAKLKKKEELAPTVYAEYGCVKHKDTWVSLKDLQETVLKAELDKREADYMKTKEHEIKTAIAAELRDEGLL